MLKIVMHEGYIQYTCSTGGESGMHGVFPCTMDIHGQVELHSLGYG
jgi:hypothetical protein